MTRNPASERSPPGTVRAPRPWLLLCCVLVAVLASYLPVLGAPLVWDDQHLIQHTPLVQSLHPLPEYFEQGFWQGDDLAHGRIYYRPLTILSLALDRSAHGDSPAGFHLTNLGVHLLSTVLLFWLLRARGSAGSAAALGAGLWALHPRLTEAVSWISGRSDVLAAFFVLAALLVQTRPGDLRRAVTALLLLLALMSKEVALAGVAAVLLSELVAAGSVSARVRRMLPTALALALYLALRQNATGLASHEASRQQHLLPGAAAVGHYLIMLLTPWLPNLQIGSLSRPSTGYAVLGCVSLLAGFYWAIRRGARPRPEQLAPLSLLIVSLSLVLHLIPINLNVVAADRFLYLPLLGLTLLFTPAVEKLAAPLVAVGCALLAVSFALATYLRNETWSDEVELWTVTYEANPDHRSVACVELGRLYARAGLLAQAVSIDQDCVADGYHRSVLSNNAAFALARSGRFEAAIQQLAPLRPELSGEAIFGLNLALFKGYLGDFAGARAELGHALAVDPRYGDALELQKKLPDLERERQRVEALPSSTPSAERAKALAKVGLTVPALAAWREALASSTASREQFEDGLWFALAQGEITTVEELHRRYRARFAEGGNPELELAYEAQHDLVRRLLSAWPRLGLQVRPLPT